MTKNHDCSQCGEPIPVPDGAATVTCPGCQAILAVDVDADWDSETGWRDLTTLTVASSPLSPEDVKLNGMDQEASDFMEEGR